ncbi:Transposase [Caenorhabditis elegans]|uniref:Transposase n=3 Tax=Caenorhabditis elegans TaxID=6239 RepID=C7IVR7_CAEEL|nr:Transposase [Caenorhabditis elegans]CCD68275.2 Transposase [Caenorhabditis elegans]
MIPSTSTDLPIPDHITEIPVESDYEDAVSSGEELSKLCDSLKSHLGTVTKMRRSKKSVSKLLSNQERMAQYYSRESSSEHSSLEKLQPDEIKNRRITGPSKGRRSNSGSDHSSDWKVLNLAFQEMAHYPLLMQLNEQLMEISRQLNSVETTNALQLKVIMHLLNRVSKRRTTWTQSICRFFRNFQFFFFAFSWPFIARLLYISYLKMMRNR